MGYPYDVLAGDSVVFDPREELVCPFSKVLIGPWSRVDSALGDALAGTDRTFGANVRAILNRTIADQRVCSYHYARAVTSALVEAVGGHSGPEYREFEAPLGAVAQSLVVRGYSPAWGQEAGRWIGEFIDAAETGGLRQFVRLYSATRKAIT